MADARRDDRRTYWRIAEEMGRLRDEIARLRRTLVPTPPDSPSPLVADATMFDEVRNPIR